MARLRPSIFTAAFYLRSTKAVHGREFSYDFFTLGGDGPLHVCRVIEVLISRHRGNCAG
jgi:hypothetical protein